MGRMGLMGLIGLMAAAVAAAAVLTAVLSRWLIRRELKRMLAQGCMAQKLAADQAEIEARLNLVEESQQEIRSRVQVVSSRVASEDYRARKERRATRRPVPSGMVRRV